MASRLPLKQMDTLAAEPSCASSARNRQLIDHSSGGHKQDVSAAKSLQGAVSTHGPAKPLSNPVALGKLAYDRPVQNVQAGSGGSRSDPSLRLVQSMRQSRFEENQISKAPASQQCQRSQQLQLPAAAQDQCKAPALHSRQQSKQLQLPAAAVSSRPNLSTHNQQLEGARASASERWASAKSRELATASHHTENCQPAELRLSALLHVDQDEVHFARASFATTVTLTNVSRGYVAYKFKASTSACLARPASGTMKPGERRDVRLSLGATVPDRQAVREKYLVRSIPVQSPDALSRDEWAAMGKSSVRETCLSATRDAV